MQPLLAHQDNSDDLALDFFPVSSGEATQGSIQWRLAPPDIMPASLRQQTLPMAQAQCDCACGHNTTLP